MFVHSLSPRTYCDQFSQPQKLKKLAPNQRHRHFVPLKNKGEGKQLVTLLSNQTTQLHKQDESPSDADLKKEVELIIQAIKKGYTYLIKSHASHINVNQKDAEGKTVLHYAIEQGDEEIVRLILKHCTNVDIRNSFGQTPLILVAQLFSLDEDRPQKNQQNKQRCFEIIRLLMLYGADVNAQDEGGRTALHYLSQKGVNDIIEVLLFGTQKGKSVRNKVLVNITDDEGCAPIHYASFEGHRDVCELLYQQGADMNLRDIEGKTALHYAGIKGQMKVIRFLLSKGIKDIPDKQGRRTLYYACREAKLDVCQLLYRGNVNMTEGDNNGKTAFHCAAEKGHIEIIRFFVEKGIQDVPDHNGDRAYEYSVKTKQNQAVTRYLFQTGNYGDNPIHLEPIVRSKTEVDKKKETYSKQTTQQKIIKWVNPRQKLYRKQSVEPFVLLQPTTKKPRILLRRRNKISEGLTKQILNKEIEQKLLDIKIEKEEQKKQVGKIFAEYRSKSYFIPRKKDSTTLLATLKNNDVARASRFIETGRSSQFNWQDENGNTPLHMALNQGYISLALVLIKKMNSSSLGIRNKQGQTAFHILCQSKNLYAAHINLRCILFDLALKMIEKMSPKDLAIQDKKERTALHILCQSTSTYEHSGTHLKWSEKWILSNTQKKDMQAWFLQVVTKLIEKMPNASFGLKDNKSRTALHTLYQTHKVLKEEVKLYKKKLTTFELSQAIDEKKLVERILKITEEEKIAYKEREKKIKVLLVDICSAVMNRGNTEFIALSLFDRMDQKSLITCDREGNSAIRSLKTLLRLESHFYQVFQPSEFKQWKQSFIPQGLRDDFEKKKELILSTPIGGVLDKVPLSTPSEVCLGERLQLNCRGRRLDKSSLSHYA